MEQDRESAHPSGVTLDGKGLSAPGSSGAHPSGVTLDDVEVALWRSLGLKETQLVDNVLRVVQAYGDARAGEKAAGAVGMTDEQRAAYAEELVRELEKDPAWKHKVVVRTAKDREGWPFNLVDDEDREVHAKEGHPPYAGDPVYVKDGHPPFSGTDNSSSVFSPSVPESEDEDTERYFFETLHSIMAEFPAGHPSGIPENSDGEFLSCKRCGKKKRAEHFSLDRSRKRGRRWNCRLCEADMRREKSSGKRGKN